MPGAPLLLVGPFHGGCRGLCCFAFRALFPVAWVAPNQGKGQDREEDLGFRRQYVLKCDPRFGTCTKKDLRGEFTFHNKESSVGQVTDSTVVHILPQT